MTLNTTSQEIYTKFKGIRSDCVVVHQTGNRGEYLHISKDKEMVEVIGIIASVINGIADDWGINESLPTLRSSIGLHRPNTKGEKKKRGLAVVWKLPSTDEESIRVFKAVLDVTLNAKNIWKDLDILYVFIEGNEGRLSEPIILTEC